MRKNRYLPANLSLNSKEIPKTAEEEEERMKRIFELVPRSKRSLPRFKKPSLDFSKIPRKKRTVYTSTNPTMPKWLLRVISDMKLIDKPMLITEKTLDLNDVHPNLNLLSIPFESLKRNDFLTFGEWTILEDGGKNNDGKMGVGAFLVDQQTKQWNVVLKKWVTMTDGKIVGSYQLSGEWSDVVKANGLRDDDHISLWFFRRNGIICFALDFAGDSIDFL